MNILSDFHSKQRRCSGLLLLHFEVTQFRDEIVRYPPVILCLRHITRILKDEGRRFADIWFCKVDCPQEVCVLERRLRN